MKHQSPNPVSIVCLQYPEPDLSHVYLAYTPEGAEEAVKPRTSKGKKSSKTSKSDRPKTSKK